jgi:hypothetical protein
VIAYASNGAAGAGLAGCMKSSTIAYVGDEAGRRKNERKQKAGKATPIYLSWPRS